MKECRRRWPHWCKYMRCIFCSLFTGPAVHWEDRTQGCRVQQIGCESWSIWRRLCTSMWKVSFLKHVLLMFAHTKDKISQWKCFDLIVVYVGKVLYLYSYGLISSLGHILFVFVFVWNSSALPGVSYDLGQGGGIICPTWQSTAWCHCVLYYYTHYTITYKQIHNTHPLV